MQFECYDVLDIRGDRYIVGEKITYRECNPLDAPKKSSHEKNPYQKHKKRGYWYEYGITPIDSKVKFWLTISDDDKYATFSHNSYIYGVPKSFNLCEEGIQEVTTVEGRSDAHIGDRADYREYERIEYPVIKTFFVEKWHEGITTYSEGEKILLSDIHHCKDAAALKVSQRAKTKANIRVLSYVLFVVLLGFYIFASMLTGGEYITWRGIREGLRIPYTMEEYIGDSSYFTEENRNGAVKVYSTNHDPVSVAVEFIDAVNGKLLRDVENLTVGHEKIVLYTRDEVCLIYTVDAKTYIEIVHPKKITEDMQNNIDSMNSSTDVLLRYADTIKEKDNRGRETFNKDVVKR